MESVAGNFLGVFGIGLGAQLDIGFFSGLVWDIFEWNTEFRVLEFWGESNGCRGFFWVLGLWGGNLGKLRTLPCSLVQDTKVL